MPRVTKDGKVKLNATLTLPYEEYERLDNGEIELKKGLREHNGRLSKTQPEISLLDERKEAMKDGMAELGMMFIESLVVDMLIPTVKAITVHKILPAIRKKKDEIVSRITQPAEAPAAEIKSTKIIDINNYRETA
jgi:hypothetical protein